MADGIPSLTRPISLLQGGIGIVYREPVMVDGQYWGLVSTAINIELLLQTAFADLVRKAPYAIGVAEPGQDEVLLAGAGELLTSPTLVAVSSIATLAMACVVVQASVAHGAPPATTATK